MKTTQDFEISEKEKDKVIVFMKSKHTISRKEFQMNIESTRIEIENIMKQIKQSEESTKQNKDSLAILKNRYASFKKFKFK